MTSNHLLLYRLAELMLEHEQHILPVDLLFDDEQIGDFVKSIQIDSPYQQLLLEGVLTESIREEKLYVGYTVEGYFHYVLGEVIYNKTKGDGAEELKQIVEENRLVGAKKGVEQCLIRDVQQNDLSRLMTLIDSRDKTKDVCTLPLAFSFIYSYDPIKSGKGINETINNQISFVLNELLAQPSDNHIEVLTNSIGLLEKAHKTELTSLLYIQINERIEPDGYTKSMIFIDSCSFLLPDKKIISKINQIEYNFESSTYEIFIALANLYLKWEDYQSARKYYEKALTICNNPFKKLDAFINLGYFHTSIGEVDKALEYYLCSYEIFQSLSNKKEFLDKVLSALAVGYSDLGKYTEAIELLFKVLKNKLSVNGPYSTEVMVIYYNIGSIYLENNSADKGIFYLEKSLNINRKIYHEHPNQVLSNIFFRFSKYFQSINELNQAIIYLDKTLEIEIKLNGIDAIEVRNLRIDLGECYFKMESFINAIKYFKCAFDDLSDNIIIAHKIGECYIKLGLPEESLQYFTKCDTDWNDRSDEIYLAAKFALDTSIKYKLKTILPNWILSLQ